MLEGVVSVTLRRLMKPLLKKDNICLFLLLTLFFKELPDNTDRYYDCCNITEVIFKTMLCTIKKSIKILNAHEVCGCVL